MTGLRVDSISFRYREHIVWTDKTLNLKLLRKGVLTRIYAPMVCLLAWSFPRSYPEVC